MCKKIVKGDLINKIKNNMLKHMNLTKKDLVNSIYMQLGFSKKFLKILLMIFSMIFENIKDQENLNFQNLGPLQ